MAPQKIGEERRESDSRSMLSFVPAGYPRSIAEYFVAHIPGAVLLFAFFVAAEAGVAFFARQGGSEWVGFVFLPVACIVPLISGVVSLLVLEKIREKPIDIKRGALVGALGCASGATLSAIMLLAAKFMLPGSPFGFGALGGIVFFIVLPVMILLEIVLGALGGALAAKFITNS
ncbi:MAG: hypothetical protein N3E51_00265 [Candidatus Micrarchaeota archaeon]|nr:hypothetical protein [Candidatus Micrarchaeota archaeon]